MPTVTRVGYAVYMTTTQHISTLTLTTRAFVHSALMCAGVYGVALTDAMDSRLCDLQDTLTAEDYATVARLEREQAAWTAISNTPNGLTHLVPTALESYALTNHFN